MLPHDMCYSNFGNGAISITQWGFINDHYKVSAIGQWGKTKITVMGFALTVAVQRIFIQNEKDEDTEKPFLEGV